MKAKVRVLVLCGDGLNCEEETSRGFTLAGAEPSKVHITDLLDGTVSLNDFQILAFVGGFANGDHLGAGTVQSHRFKTRLRADLQLFLDKKKPIIGICNGFQTIVKLGLLPGKSPSAFKQEAVLMINDSGKYEDRWVHLLMNENSPCIWTRGMKYCSFPVRHKEGKFLVQSLSLMETMKEKGQLVARYIDPSTQEATQKYPYNPNGSEDSIAAVCDSSGLIFGLMPHPEAYLHPFNHPQWKRDQIQGKPLPQFGQGLQLFQNAVSYV